MPCSAAFSQSQAVGGRRAGRSWRRRDTTASPATAPSPPNPSAGHRIRRHQPGRRAGDGARRSVAHAGPRSRRCHADRANRGALRPDLAGADGLAHGDGLRADQYRPDLAPAGPGQPSGAGQPGPDRAGALADGPGDAPAGREGLSRGDRAVHVETSSISREAWTAGTQPIKAFMVDQIKRTNHEDYLQALYEYAVPPSPGQVDPPRPAPRTFRCAWWRRPICSAS